MRRFVSVKTVFLIPLAVALSSTAFFVYAATVDRTEYVLETLKVVPTSITSDTWTNVSNIAVQDLGSSAFAQSFSNENSAFISFGRYVETESVTNNSRSTTSPSVTNASSTDQGLEESNVETENSESQNENSDAQTDDVVPESEVTEDTQTNPAEDLESQNSEDANSTSSDETTVMREATKSIYAFFASVTKVFPFANNASLTAVSEPDENQTEEVETVEIESTVATSSDEAEQEVLGTSTSTEEEIETIEEPEGSATSTDETGIQNDVVTNASSSSTTVPQIPSGESTVSSTTTASSSGAQDVVTEPVVESEYVQTPCLISESCQAHAVLLEGFDVPEINRASRIEALQLRMSLGGRPLDESDALIQRLRIEYTFDTVWADAGLVDLTEEVSNSINGDYYLFALPIIKKHESLDKLKVRVVYEGDVSEMDELYIDALWLEVFSGQFYEPSDFEEPSDEIIYQRSLTEPTLNEFTNPINDFAVQDEPQFGFTFKSQKSFIARTFNSIFGDRDFTVEKVTLRDPSYIKTDATFDIQYLNKDTWSLKLLKKPQKIKPGKYTIEVLIKEGDEEYIDTFEFYWGVLAVNTEKSMYHEGEDASLYLAALTDKGDTICDADLHLTITDPSYTIHELDVNQTGFCGENNVTDRPDYEAVFDATSELGLYKIELEHFNTNGDLVHKIKDSFEVREYIPYDITRSAPTRIYPPAPYEVQLSITANRSFKGDITEKVPRGFVITDLEGATISSLPDYELITWKDVVLEEGEELELSYTFDAPDVSPYLYLLGPLNMDGFEELREWQIASDALGAVAWLTGTETLSGPDLNDTASAFVWSTSTFDGLYFAHATSSNPEQLTVKQDGDYLFSVTLPVERTDSNNNSRTRTGISVYVNGVPVPEGLGRSAYIRHNNAQLESSSHVNVLLNDLQEDDYVEIYVEGLTTIDSGDDVVISGQAGMYVEYIPSSETIFSATTTRSVASTSLNEVAASPMEWTETRQDSGFLHSDSVNPEDIVISDAGAYLVTVNIPLSGNQDANDRQNIMGRILLDGVQVAGGQFAQGYIRNTENDFDSSIHWSGVVVATTTNQTLTVSVEQEGDGGYVLVTPGYVGSIYIQELPASDVLFMSGTDLIGGTDWSESPAEEILWDTEYQKDGSVFTHSTTTNEEDITVLSNGDYLLVYNDALNTNTGRANTRITVEVDGVPITGAEVKSHYTRSATLNETSGAFTYLLEGLTSGQTITVLAEQEGANSNTNDSSDALLLLWRKDELNLQPDVVTMYDTPFDNVSFASSTPYFEFSASDPDGSSDIQYQFSISTTSDFSASTTRTSGVDTGFTNTVNGGDTNPFNETERVRFQLQPADALVDETTYYWRVRAQDVGGSGNYSEWSTTQSLTYKSANNVPVWYQSFDGQFETDVLTGTRISGTDSVEVDVVDNTDVLLVYGEGTDTTPKYRIWNGTTWGSELNAQNVGAEILWTRTAAGVTRDEYIAMTLDADSDVNVQVYSASTTSWGNLSELSTTVGDVTNRGIDVVYETVSGDAMAVMCDGGADPVYSIWDGSSWSAPASINVTTASECNWITMASDPLSDEIIMVHRGAADDYEAFVWDGDAWGNAQIVGRVGDTRMEGVDVIYEESGDQAIVVTTDAGDNEFMYTAWDGTDWSTALAVPHNADFENGYLSRDDGTDRVALCMIDSGNDVQAIIWDGAAWGSFEELTASGNSQVGRPVDCEFETVAGRDGNLIVPYSDNIDDQYQVYDGSSWSGELDLSDITDSWFVQTERSGDGTIIAMYFDDAGDDLQSSIWNGTSWTDPSENLEDSPSAINYNPRYESFSMSAKVFQYAQGTVRSNPIDFDFVPNQLTWGDVDFETTEPVGSNVHVRLYYTNTETCDTLVPDIDLSGNSVGFTSTSTPIDLSGLSTTTYSQLCMEATVSVAGNNSATLNEWTLSWQRVAKLQQFDYRWYDNISAFTPVDPWPAGADDLSENEPMTGETAIRNGDETRLRMSLLGSNIDLPASSETFKLQFAENASCSLATEWYDVGEIGSSTAQWRGFSNAIVGSDWYDEDWARRVEITIDNSQVDDDLTDFPVYLDLADLPTQFFANVQSDGDDIRITESDGLSEVPYELVSINTGAESGELHFRADLSSTTDTTFFVYYGNGSASGYAAGATYGSENVWSNNFDLRYALDEDPTGSSPQFIDSTDNNVNAVARSGMSSGDVVTGQIGNAINHDGNDGAVFQTPLAYSGTYTISGWWRSSGDGFWVSTNAGSNEKIGPWSGGNTFVRVLNAGGNDQTISSPTDGTWAHIVFTRDSSNKIDYYINGGAPNRLFSDSAQSGTATWENFGGQTSQGFRGDLDELRFASVKRSDEWVSTEYNNQVNPTGFYAVSSEELVSDGRQISSTVLASSTLRETYEEESPAGPNYNAIAVDEVAEWDFVLENNAATAGATYCFRMVYEDDSVLDTYTKYPTLVTNGPPDAPILSAPFDNEQFASTSPWFEFAADDSLDDDILYQIQVDDDYDFGSVALDRNSATHFSQFVNLSDSNDKNPFASGATVRFTSATVLSDSTTYWWRVRARDPDASGAYGDWSTPQSFRVDTGTTITTWHQRTQEQFETNDLEETETNAADDVRVASLASTGTTTSTAIDYDDLDTGNAWGSFDVGETLNGSNITYYIEYESASDVWTRIPDSALSGNESGFTTADFPVNLVTLDTDIYNVIRLVAILTDTGTSPELDDWTIEWGERVAKPTQFTPFNHAKVATTSPSFTFYSTDPDEDVLEYEIQLSASSSFAASSTYLTGNFASGVTVQFDLPSTLTSSSTYWWRVRARDPLGDNVFSQYSDAFSFTVDESISVSTWFQTTNDQFEDNANTDIETVLNNAQVTSIVREAMVAYGEAGSLAPRYRIWDGSAWGEEGSAVSVDALIEWVSLEASPTRDEYAMGTFGNDNDFNFQIYTGGSSSWGNVLELATDFDYTENSRGFDVAYEQSSGDLMAVSCEGTEAVYAIWNGSSWSATTTINLTNANDCYWIELASDPVSDEIIMAVRHNIAGATDYEVMVWDGSSWGDNITFGSMLEEDSFGIALEYEESGDEALVVLSNGGASSFIYDVWGGSSWAGSNTVTLGDDFEWGMFAQDVGSDNLALCYNDNDQDLGIVEWDGSSWGSFTEVTTIAETKDGKPISCQYMTDATNDGDVLIVYTDNNNTTNEGGWYNISSGGVVGAAIDLNDVEDAQNVQTVRTEDGVVLAIFFDHQTDDYDFTYWNGSAWAADDPLAISGTPSVSGSPFTESAEMAARTYPNFIAGQLVTDPIDYDNGTGPRWEQLLFNETTPGSSYINYQVYYNTGTTTALVPDLYLSGNSSGFTSSPVSLATLDKNIHNELTIEADLTCISGDCPQLHDWTVEWSEGITVSGMAYENDESTVLTSGTVAIVVDGVLQPQTGTIAGDGSWSVNNVTIFEGETLVAFIDGVVADADEAIAATRYDGNGDITGMELSKRHLTIGSNDESNVVTNTGLAGYDTDDNENLFFDVDGSNVLTLCGDTGCGDNELKILSGATYQPGANSSIHDFENNGTLSLGSSILRVGGSYVNNATTTMGTGAVYFTATTTTETLTGSSSMNFYDVQFGEGSGTASWLIPFGLDVENDLLVNFGTLARATNTIAVGHDLSVGASGAFTGIGTTTFDGATPAAWSDASASSTNIGRVLIDGTTKTLSVTSDVRAESITIASDDILRGGTGNTIYVETDFINNNSFVDDTSILRMTATSSAVMQTNGSDLYSVYFDGVGGSWSFVESSVTVADNFTIATGTVALPSGTLSVGGSFVNTGGLFAHNNGTVAFTSSSAGEQVGLMGDAFFNALYNASFTGSGVWSFIDTNATTSNDLLISAGTVTFPTGSLTVGGDVTVSGSGAISHNDGKLILLVQDNDSITTNGSSLNNVSVRAGSASGSWYNDNWSYRLPITIDAAQVDDDLANFPVYVDLADLSSNFFTNVRADGGDIRITEADGMTEVPREIVSIDTGAENGELHFRATNISSTTDTTFYVYYGNASQGDYAVTDTNGAENVWSNGYVLVAHMNDLTTSTILNSANGSFNGTKASAGNPNETTTGKLYEAQEDGATDHIAFGNVGGGATNISISAWFNADDLSTVGGDSNVYGATIFSAHSGGNYTWLTAGGTGNGGSPSEVRFCAFSSSAVCNVASGSNLSVDTWHYVSAAAIDGGASTVRVDGTQVLSFTSDGGGTWNSGSTIGDLRPSRNIEFDGELDEIQISNVVRSTEWQDATYRNQATTTDFYTASAQEVPANRTFADTNATILGNLTLETGGDSVFPSGTLSIGGSFDNDADFDANTGVVEFNSVSGAETVAAGNSSFATLAFDSTTGDFTITENATATVSVLLTGVGDFTLNSGLVLESTGTFTNSANKASTTWTGSTLRLSSGTDFAINTSADEGDTYATLLLTGDTGVSMWNSDASVYTTLNTSSIYSQDHAEADGDLYIFGDYERTTGTEYWSYTTDFDGTDLSGGSERQVDVRVENGASITVSTSTLAILGSATASTTVDAQSGTFALTSNYATVTSQYFEMTGTDANGFNLTASSTVTLLDDALFSIGVGVSAITVDASTVDTNPASQFFNTDFVTAGGSANVTLSGSPNSYWWFRNGQGDRYGEAFDNADGDPGSIRWDDSSYNIVVSGTIYADDGTTPLGGPTCDGVTNNVRIVVNGGTYTSATSCNGANGTYSFPAVSYAGDPSIIVYLDTNGGVQGSVVTKTPTADITDLDVYADRVVVRHEDTAPLNIADMARYDNADDSDIRFTAATSTTDLLTVLPDTGLYVFATTTFAPAGTVTLESGGTGSVYDGTLHIGNDATFAGAGTTTYSIGGSFLLETGATFVPASTSVVMTATTSGKAISATAGTTSFYELTFNGSGGGWNINSDIAVDQDLLVSDGTVTGTGNILVQNGSFYGNGQVSLGGGETTIRSTNTLGGTTAWTFNDLSLGNGLVSGSTTPASSATTTVAGVLTIATGHELDAGSSVWNLTGSGNVFVEGGTFLEDTSTVAYGGSLGSNILSTDYYNLSIAGDGGAPTFTFSGTALQTLNDFTVAGSVATIANLNTNDPVFQVGGDVLVSTNGVLVGSDSTALTVFGSWDNNGTFTSSGGQVLFTSTDAFIIAAGSSSFADLSITGAGTMQFTENATSTGVLTFGSSANTTINTGVTLAVGTQFDQQVDGANTTWTGSTLYLYGGDYELNASTTSDTYETFRVASGAEVRTWGLSASAINVDAGGSLYSQDHAGIDGDLYIYGDFSEESRNDYWSYATDFDGTDLSGGSERQVDVYVEGDGSIRYTGGSLTIEGVASATTTLQNQGSGTYGLQIGGSSTFDGSYVSIRDIDSDGLIFSGTPTVTDLANADFLVEINSATAITVGGTVIDANPAKNFQDAIFSAGGGVTGAVNVTATGTSVSSWRYTNHLGNIDGEAFDSDPAGDPGYVVWDDSAAIITISGNVYQSDTSSVSSVCDDSTTNIVLAVDGVITPSASSSCASADGSYSISGISFSPNDTLTLFIDGEAVQAANVSIDPVSSIGNMHLYENHVIVRHENTDPITIADLNDWDSDDDADIPFTAEVSGSHSVTLPANTKLIIWNSKEFAPNGDVILSGGGAGASYDGTFELYANATFTADDGEAHSIGGSFILGSGAVFTPAESAMTFTTTGSGRTVDVNNQSFFDVDFNGSGSWSITDTTFAVDGDATITAGAVTLPSATSTFAGSFENTGGSFDANNGLIEFTATAGGNTVEFGGSDAHTLVFDGVGGSWTMSDTNATTTANLTVANGSLTLPSGALTVGSSFANQDTLVHNSGTLRMSSTTGTSTILLQGNDLYSLTVAGAGSFVMEDASASLLGDLVISAGTLHVATNTLAVGGSLDATGGVFNTASGTILFNSSDTGETVDAGANNFYNIVFGSGSGGWTLNSATTTNNFTLSSANTFTLASSEVLTVSGVFTNQVGGANTTWTGSTVRLTSAMEYSINTKSGGGDVYNQLVITNDTDIRAWDSSATSLVVDPTASFYSQDNAGVAGDLYIYGDFHVATTTEYWSYATDFDGAALGGSSRQVNVYIADGATTTVDGGSLQIVGIAGATTTVQAVTPASEYSFDVSAGTLNAAYYEFENIDVDGLLITNTPTITNISNGRFLLTADTGSAVTVTSEALNVNASKVFTNVGFVASTSVTGNNVSLITGTTSNAWRFSGSYGDISGELFDNDGATNCGSIRWDDSSCLLVEQTHYRWRNDDGGLGAPNSEWFDLSWNNRKRVRVSNNDNQTYSSTTVKLSVTYDSDMLSNFDDLRFTDSDGLTEVPYWIEEYTASTDATVWVLVPTLLASDATDLYMYYGNVLATSTASSGAAFIAADDFEDGDIAEYSGDTGLFSVDGSYAYGGSNGLDTTGFESTRATDGIGTILQTVSQGEIIRYMQYVNETSGPSDEACTLFGVQSVAGNTNYGVCLELFGTERLSLVKNAESTDSFGGVTVLASTTVNYSDGWYEVEIDWQTDNTIDVSLYTEAGSLVATTSATDATYSSGGFGFTYWGQNGGWDSFTSRVRVDTAPSVTFGAEQVSGGASWNRPLDIPSTGFEVGDVARLRIAIENSGLAITDQEFLLEYAEKGAAPSCEAVATGGYASVPAQASCGSSPLCMVGTSNYADSDSTFDLLEGTNGNFVTGEAVEDPSNITNVIDVDQDEYVELEYALTSTVNATADAYCLRLTDNGSAFDSYASVAEFALQFDPTVTGVSLNGGADISLTPGATTTIYATGTVTDLNGYADLVNATSTMYRSGAGAACTADDNNCYISTAPQCTFNSCAGNSCEVSCSADIYFHADATDVSPYEGEEWLAYIEVSDQAGGIDIGSALGVEMLSLQALDVTQSISYGALSVASTTGNYNASTSVQNLGNVPIDINLEGTDLTDGGSSAIPASEQKFATSTFNYTSCVYCTNLSTSTITGYEVDLSKPTAPTPPVEDVIYWGIEIPFGVSSNPHTGVNTFYAASD